MRRYLIASCTIASVLALALMAGCGSSSNTQASTSSGTSTDSTSQQTSTNSTTGQSATGTASSTASSTSSSSTSGSDEIVAGTVDTSSKYSFQVDEAIVGLDKYSGVPEVILACTFTNNSDKTVSFGSALDATAFQGGYELPDAYLSGASEYNYENIEPGHTMPVFIGWELEDSSSPVQIKVIDEYHYAKAEVFNQTYTIDELVANTEQYLKDNQDAGDIIEEDNSLAA